MTTHTIASGSQSVWYGTTSNYSHPPPTQTLVNNSVISTNPALSATDAGSEVADDAITFYETNGLTLINTGSIISTYSGTNNLGYGVEFIGSSGQQISITNAAGGVIEDSGGSGDGILIASGTIVNEGLISGGPGANPYPGVGVFIGGYSGFISNSGTIAGGGIITYPAYHPANSLPTTIVNTGKILGLTASNSKYGAIDLQTGGIITNLATGTISGENGTYGVRIKGAAGTVINAGYISNGSSGGDAVTLAAGYANLVVVDPGAKFKGIVDGGAAAGSSLELGSGAAKGTLSGFGSEYINFGTLTLEPSASWLIEASTAVTAAVINGFAANDTIDLAGFVAVSRTFASNTLVLTNASNAHETLHIVGTLTTNNFTVGSDGSGGTDIVFDADTVTDLNYGQTVDEAGTVATSETVAAGTMTLFDGASAVGTVTVGTSLSSGDFLLRSDGAGGTDVIVDTVFGTYLSGVTLLVNPTTIAATARVTRSIDDASAVSGPSGTAWTLTNLGLVSETGTGGDGVSFASAGTVINAATIAGDQVGIVLAAGGSVTNQSGGTISGYDAIKALSNPATVVNAGVIAGSYTTNNADGIYMLAGGSVTNQSGGRITGDYNGIRITGARGTVINLGTVQSNDIPGQNGGAGIYLADGGAVTNGASGGTASSAYILGYDYAVKFGGSAAGTLTNFGTLSGNPGNPAVLLTTGTIINGPSGATGALIEGGDQVTAVTISGMATVINYARIVGVEDPGDPNIYYGIRLGGAAGSISNLGTHALIENYLAIYATDNDTITNAGTIASNYAGGRDALVFGGGTNRLIIDPGAVFVGTVSGSGPVTLAPSGNTHVIGTANGIGTTTLELASGSSAGTLAGLGTSIVNFTSLVFDTGAHWTVAGNDSARGLGTLGITGFTFGDTIDLSGFVAVSETFASNALVLTDGGGAHDTLAIQGAFVSGNFHLANDTAGGTDITFQTPPPVISGVVAGQTTSDEATVDPFATVSITDPNVSQTETITITLSHGGTPTDADGTLSGPGLTETGTGTYELATGTPSAVTAALDGLIFTPTAHQVNPGNSVTTTFTIQAIDTAGGTGSDSTTTVNVTAVNNPPVIAGTKAGQITTDEAAVTPFSGVAISDVDVGQTETVTVTLSAAANGTLSNLDGGNFNSSTGVYSISGTDAAVSTALDGLVFTPTAHQMAPGSSVTTTFTIATTDTAGGTSSDSTTTVAVTAVNNPPVIAGAVAGQATTDEATVTPLSGVTISDVDFGQTETVTVTLSSAANGTLSNLDGGSYDSATGVYTVTGADAAVSAAMDGLVFTPTEHQVAPGSSVTTTFSIQATDTAGGIGSDSTTTVIATAVNDPPVIAGAVAGQTTSDEAAISPFSGVAISDVDVGQTETVTVTLSSSANGTLSNLGGGSYNGATGVYSVTGSDAAVSAAVDGLVFTPTAHQVAPGSSVTTTFSIHATDTAGGTSSDSTTTVIATAANDPPVIAGAVAGQTMTDEAAITPFSGASVSDVDFGQTETVTVTLSSAANGTLSDVDGGNFNSGTGVYTITGTDNAVTTALKALVFTPTPHQVAPGSSVTTTFTIQAIDTAGGTGSDSTTTVGVTAVNNPPVIAGTTAGQITTDEAAVTPFSGVAISDVDFGQTETVTVTLSAAANGTLSNLDGGSFNGSTGVYSISGTDAAVSTALDGLVFTPTAHQVAPGSSVTTTFTIATTDTAGGTSSDSTTTVAVTAVNDPPVIAGAVAGQATTDEATVTPLSGVTISDVDFGQTETVTVTLSSAANGTLSNLDGGSYDSATGVYTVTGADAAVSAAMDGLVFTPTEHQVAPGSSVTTTFSIQATDTAGGIGSDSTTTVIATAVNDPPVIAGAVAGQTTSDEAAISPFSGVAISDVDVGQTETVTVTLSSSANGTLSNLGGGSYNGATGVYSVTGSDAAVSAAVDGLVFTPTAHQVAPGSSVTTTFSIHATDTAGGTSSDSTTTVIATAANDPPVIAGAVAGQTMTDEAAITPFSGASVSDVDFGQTETVTVTLSSAANGTLSDVDGGNFNSGTGVYTITGTDNAVTTALKALVFTPTPHQVAPGSSVTTAFSIQATDTAGASSSNGTTTVIATAVNDPPVIAGAVAGQITTDEATITPLSGVSISDADSGQTETVTVTPSSAANGTLSDVDGGSFNSGTGVYSISGTDAAVTTALDALVFTPTAHQVAPGSSVTTTFSIHATDTAGGTSSDSTTTVAVTAVNNPPVIAGAVAGQATTDEATVTPLSGVTISDVDFGQTETVTVTLSSTANGTLSNLDGGSFNGSTGVYSISGTDAAVSTALDGLIFTPTAHQVKPGNSVTTTFTIQATDTAGGTSSDSTTTVNVTAVNNPPVIAGTKAGQITTDEAAVTPFSGVAISDVDFGQTETVTVTLSAAANGTLSNLDGGNFNSSTGVYSISGTDAAVSTALDGLVFTPTAHQVAPGSSVTTTFTIVTTDTAGGTSSDSTTTVAVTAVNDPPVIAGAVAGQATTDEVPNDPFSGLSISDPDFNASETVTITLTAGALPSDANGILSGVGLSKTGIGTYALTAGTPAAVTAALQALVFTPTAHEVAPGETITTGMILSVSDGIAGSPTTDTTTSVVTTAANDPPVIAGTVAGQLINDDQTKRPFSTVTISDPDVGASETVAITLNVDGVPSDANGTLSGAGLTKTGAGAYTLTAGTPAAVTAALRALVFTPAVFDLAPDTSVVTEMTLSVSDGIVGSPTTDTTTSVAIVPCFAAGTRIATPGGAMPVERLREGDVVLTVSGKTQPIQWIGHRTLDCNRHLSPERVKPIRIAPHAFGENRPKRGLLLSPDHSVFVEDVLIPIKHLINGTTVTQIEVATVTYYHIELPRHDVVLAEGLPAETYLETGARFAFENGGGALQLHPDFAPDEARVGMVWQNFSYAPLIGADGQLNRVRARLALQALMLDQQANDTSQRGNKRARR